MIEGTINWDCNGARLMQLYDANDVVYSFFESILIGCYRMLFVINCAFDSFLDHVESI